MVAMKKTNFCLLILLLLGQTISAQDSNCTDLYVAISEAGNNNYSAYRSTMLTNFDLMTTSLVDNTMEYVHRGMVAESRDVWFEGDGALTKELCEEQQENDDEQPEIHEPCCACDEAKYEVPCLDLRTK